MARPAAGAQRAIFADGGKRFSSMLSFQEARMRAAFGVVLVFAGFWCTRSGFAQVPEDDATVPAEETADVPVDPASPSDPAETEPTAEPPPDDEPVEAVVPVEPGSDIVEDLEESDDSFAEDFLETLSLHGFASQGFILTIGNNYLDETKDGSFEFTEVGLNVTTEPVEHFRIGVQLFARDLGPVGNFDARFDWFYADYRFADWLGVRVGRTKVPFGLYNEENDVDVAHAPVLLPQSVYPTSSRDILLAQTGVELYGLGSLGDGGALDYRVYAGTVFAEPDQTPGSPFVLGSFEWPYLVGGRLMWETPLEGLRAGGSVQVLRFDTEFLRTDYQIVTDPMTMTEDVIALSTPFSLTVNGVLWVASAEYSAGDLLLAAEYSRWHLWAESSDQTVVPDGTYESERLYGSIAYRFVDWFQASFYYSLLFPDISDRTGRAQRLHDFALTVRFDLNDYWLVKLEGHYMNGTAGLSSALNDGRSLDALPEHWALFLVKTTAYF
jgi:hypothetical protein